MIATKRFVHIHLHKSGGTFVNECLLRFFPEARWLGYHLPRSMIPAELDALPVFGLVRNPWSYYVSWYTFQSQRPQPNTLFRCLSENGTLDFNATIRNMLGLGDPHGKLDELLSLLPSTYGKSGLNLPAFALAPIRNSSIGFYSYLFRYMYAGGLHNVFIGRTETLRTDLLEFLQREHLEISDELLEFIQHAAVRNPSTHAAFADYYDDAMRRLVEARDSMLIGQFGYRFDA